MKEWLHTQDSCLTTGVTEEGHPYFEKKLQGWNQNDLSDIEDLVTVNAVLYNNGLEMNVKNIYSSKEALENAEIRKKGEEIEQLVLQEAQLWANGAI